MNLVTKQKVFARLIAAFILKAYELGYEITFGEFWRPDETARLYADKGIGIANSLHRIRLAADINAFKEGRFLTRTEEYRELGELWESFTTEDYRCVWGGSFRDGNHFSIEHQGVK